jgi:hypothetical protein
VNEPSEDPTVGAQPPLARDSADNRTRQRRARWLWAAAVVVLCPVAGIGAALSFQSLHKAAVPIFGPLAFGFPLLADMLILGATLAFLAGATLGRERSGWRWTAHGGVTTTLLLNALAASSPATIPWHITPALVWSILVEMTARQVTSDWKSASASSTEQIPARLWISTPLDTTRTWLWMARTGQHCHRQARADLALHAAAAQALKTAMPHRRQRGTRHLIRKQLRAGALDPTVVLSFLRGQHHEHPPEHHTAVVIQAFLTEEAHPDTDGTTAQPGAAPGSLLRTASAAARLAKSPSGGLSDPLERATSDSRAQRLSEVSAAKRSVSAPELRHRRCQAAMEILQRNPKIDGPQLARELTDHGWPVSPRTARRILTQASQEIASQSDAPR